MKSNCISCDKEIVYNPSQSSGKYCSNKCQGFYQRKLKVESGNVTNHRMVRQYLIERNIYECSECGIKNWNNKPISLQLDHINGNNKDNRLENVRWLCPNYHSQTDTWGVGNMSEEGRKKCSTKHCVIK